MKVLPPLLLLLFVACTSSAQPRELTPAVRSTKVLELVRVDQPVRFWQAGKFIESRDAVVLEVVVENPYDFAPRGIASPGFVYGNTVCRVLVSPVLDGTAILLAPPLRASDPDTLRVIPALQVRGLDERTFGRMLQRSSAVPVAKPDAATPATPRALPSVEKLRDEWFARRKGQS